MQYFGMSPCPLLARLQPPDDASAQERLVVRTGFLPEDLEVLLPQFTHRHPFCMGVRSFPPTSILL